LPYRGNTDALGRRARHHPPGPSGLVADSLPSGHPLHTRGRPPRRPDCAHRPRRARQARAVALTLRDSTDTYSETSEPRRGQAWMTESIDQATDGPQASSPAPGAAGRSAPGGTHHRPPPGRPGTARPRWRAIAQEIDLMPQRRARAGSGAAQAALGYSAISAEHRNIPHQRVRQITLRNRRINVTNP
jgi:hypothetical protein